MYAQFTQCFGQYAETANQLTSIRRKRPIAVNPAHVVSVAAVDGPAGADAESAYTEIRLSSLEARWSPETGRASATVIVEGRLEDVLDRLKLAAYPETGAM